MARSTIDGMTLEEILQKHGSVAAYLARRITETETVRMIQYGREGKPISDVIFDGCSVANVTSHFENSDVVMSYPMAYDNKESP